MKSISDESTSYFDGVYVVAKFFMSKAPDGSFNCISRSLGKFSIIDRAFAGTVNCQDVWLCKVMRELKPGQNNGAFVLRPIEKVPIDKVRKIIPGFYDVQTIGKAVCIVPNTDPSDCWMLSKATRQIFARRHYAVIVPIAYNEIKKPESEPAPKEGLRIRRVQAKVDGVVNI